MRDQKPLRWLPILLGALLVLGSLAACGTDNASAVDVGELLGGQMAAAEEEAAVEEVVVVAPTDVPAIAATPEIDENCIDCHTNQEMLTTLATATEPEETISLGEGLAGEVPPMEPWEKVLISEEAATTGVHAYIRCTECHGGNDVEGMLEAHEGVIPDPSADPQNICGDCHTDVQAAFNTSLHKTMNGLETALIHRAVPENHPVIEEITAATAEVAAATCGQCHISRPSIAGDGLIAGHQFVLEPQMTQTCAGCHGSGVVDEYVGHIGDNLPPDIHFAQGEMTCINCHSGDQLHGENISATEVYGGERIPKCESCHQAALAPDAGIEEHTIHGQDVACQVCHSLEYENYSGLQIELSEDGTPVYEIDSTWLEYRIGLNPARTPERPWQYVLVRHVPIEPDSFDVYGEDLLLNFDARPTWVEATPHTIQHMTPRSASCQNCHGNEDVFLMADDVAPEELNANRDVIVDAPPSLELLGLPAEEAPAEESTPEGQ